MQHNSIAGPSSLAAVPLAHTRHRASYTATMTRRRRTSGLALLEVEDDELKSDSRTVGATTSANIPTSSSASHLDCKACPHVRRRLRPRRARAKFMTSPLALLMLLATLLALLVQPVHASVGDRSPEYQLCVDSCDRDSCLVPPWWDDGVAHATRLPWILRVTRWTCIDDCRYHCTHRVTNAAHDRVAHIRMEVQAEVEAQAQANGWSRSQQQPFIEAKVQAKLAELRPVQKQMVQYHGKWVFIRVLGAQEPLSVLFSLMNLYVHVRALGQLRRQIPDHFPLKLVYLLHALLSCFAWTASAIFHARDKPVTERLDYYFAGAVVLGGLFYTICRLFRIKPSTRPFRILAQGMGVAFLLHVIYLSIGRFDYAYNMQANILVAIVHSLLWLTYSVNPQIFVFAGPTSGRTRSSSAGNLHTTTPRLHSNGGSPPVPVSTPMSPPPSSSRKARRGLQKILALLWLSSTLEIFDFAPLYRALDAHALWHLATVPIARMWYLWLIEDARECVTSGFWAADMDGLTAKYLQLPHKTEAAVENVGRVVGPPVLRAMEKARELIETAAGKGHDAMAATGTSSGIEFKTLTNKLNELARSTLGNQSQYNHHAREMQSNFRAGNPASQGVSSGGNVSSDEEVAISLSAHMSASGKGGLRPVSIPHKHRTYEPASTRQHHQAYTDRSQHAHGNGYSSSADEGSSGSASGGYQASASSIGLDGSAHYGSGAPTPAVMPTSSAAASSAVPASSTATTSPRMLRRDLEKYDYSQPRGDA